MRIDTSYNQTITTSPVQKEQVENTTQKEATAVLSYERNTDGEKVTYEKPKKLTSEQVSALKEQQEATQMEMLKKMISDTVANQSTTFLRATSADLITEIFGSLEAGLPSLATTPEEAQKAIEAGGAYSVEAVTERIMKMANAFVGDDTTQIEKMEKAVQEGFKAAGMDLTNGKGLPSICYDTYQATMEAFSAWKENS